MIRQVIPVLVLCASTLAVPAAGWAKGQTLRIVIRGDGLASAIEIADPEIAGQFSVYTGPGSGSRGPDGVSHPSMNLDQDQPARGFIHWARGLVDERPSGLRRFEVTFHVGFPRNPDATRRYVFLYEADLTSRRGYIYLPRWMNDLVSHRAEGNWLHASARWNDLLLPLIAERSRAASGDAEPALPACTVGIGSFGEDRVIEWVRTYPDGDRTSHWRYEPSMQEYQSVRAHIGDVTPGGELEIPCWPPRA